MNSIRKMILFLLLPVAVGAQENSIFLQKQQRQLDSLHYALKATPNDTIRMDLYKKLAFFYLQIKRDSSMYYSQQQLLTSQRLNLKLYEADALAFLGLLYTWLGNYPLAMQYLLEALKIAENPLSEKSFSSLLKDEAPKKARYSVLAFIHVILGELYGTTNNPEQELLHFRKSAELAAEVNDQFRLSLANMNSGVTYLRLNKLDSALVFEMQALENSRQSNIKRNRPVILNFIGNIYLKQENYTSAKQYFSEAIQVSYEQFNSTSLAGAFLGLAKIFTLSGHRDSSLWYAKRGLQIYQSTGSPAGLVDAYSSLATIYKSTKNLDSAIKYQELAMAAKDSLNNAERITQFQNIGFDEQFRRQELQKQKIQSQNKVRTYALLAGIAVVMVIAFLLFRNARNREKANSILKKQKAELQTTLDILKNTQSQLIQSEKMASLGQLTAGIAHEIQNPLNFVNNFSETNIELINEMKQEFATGNGQQAFLIADDIKGNEEKILFHGKRADAIVKNMLQHSRASTGIKELIDLNALVDECLRLSYHGLRAKDKSFNAKLKTQLDPSVESVNAVPQDISRVLINLFNNALYSVSEKKKQQDGAFEPKVSVSTNKHNGQVEVRVRDNGLGIPQKTVDKIFQPFFTTKPAGEGTGLGLSMSYDIIKAHGGEMRVETKEGEGSNFIINIPG